MGDVLAGIIGSLLARTSEGKKNDVLHRVAASAYVHGVAGDLAADRIGQYSLSASEILVEIPVAIGKIFG
jgi:NAD(P)H-hydrate epimerase